MSSDERENIRSNPKSWVVWKDEAESEKRWADEYFQKWQSAQQSVQRTAIAAGGLAFFAGIIISWLVLRGITRRR